MKNLILLVVFLVAFSCKTPDAREPVTKKSGQSINTAIARNKKLVAKEEKRIQSIIDKDSMHDYLTSSNGFWYRYDKKNKTDTLTPEYGDMVNFNYDISTLEGTPIYTRKEIGTREYKIDKEDVFTGLRQGLKLMKKGETVTFYFPSFKAFGYYGDNDKIGRNLPIRSTITLNLININHNPEKQPFK